MSGAPDWTPQERGELVALIRAARKQDIKYSARQIGKMLTPRRTHNAVIGKCHRIGEKLLCSVSERAPSGYISKKTKKAKKEIVLCQPPEFRNHGGSRGLLCAEPGCRNTHQPATPYCARHTPHKERLRAHMTAGIRLGMSSLGDF